MLDRPGTIILQSSLLPCLQRLGRACTSSLAASSGRGARHYLLSKWQRLRRRSLPREHMKELMRLNVLISAVYHSSVSTSFCFAPSAAALNESATAAWTLFFRCTALYMAGTVRSLLISMDISMRTPKRTLPATSILLFASHWCYGYT